MNLLLRLAILLFFGQSITAFSQQTIPFVMCYEDRQLLPYFVGSGKQVPKENPGVSIEVLRILDQERPEIAISFRREPWKRCLALLETGDISGVIASYKVNRHKIGKYPMEGDAPDESRAFEITRYCLYTKTSSNFAWNGVSFENEVALPVAIPLGYSIADLFETNEIKITDVNSSDRGFFLLKNERVSGTATLCESGGQILAQNEEYFDIKENKIPLRTKGSYLLISHQFYEQHTDISQQLWTGIVSINQRIYQEIYQRYVNE